MSCRTENGTFNYTVIVQPGDVYEIPIQQRPMVRFNGFLGNVTTLDLQVLDPRTQTSLVIGAPFGLMSQNMGCGAWFDFADYGQPSLNNIGTCIALNNALGLAPVVVSYSQKV